jgi:hypothetical protein
MNLKRLNIPNKRRKTVANDKDSLGFTAFKKGDDGMLRLSSNSMNLTELFKAGETLTLGYDGDLCKNK